MRWFIIVPVGAIVVWVLNLVDPSIMNQDYEWGRRHAIEYERQANLLRAQGYQMPELTPSVRSYYSLDYSRGSNGGWSNGGEREAYEKRRQKGRDIEEVSQRIIADCTPETDVKQASFIFKNLMRTKGWTVTEADRAQFEDRLNRYRWIEHLKCNQQEEVAVLKYAAAHRLSTLKQRIGARFTILERGELQEQEVRVTYEGLVVLDWTAATDLVVHDRAFNETVLTVDNTRTGQRRMFDWVSKTGDWKSLN